MTSIKSHEAVRSSIEFIEHLLEVGSWYGSAIELDMYADCDSDGYALRQEAEEIVRQAKTKPEFQLTGEVIND